MKKVVLDATIRDGGLINNHRFDDSFVKNIYRMNIDAGIDYMEFGYRASKKLFDSSEYGKWKFSSDEDIWDIIDGKIGKCKIAVMADVGRCDYENDIDDFINSPVELIRVATYIEQIDDAVKMIDYIIRKGYRVTCNIMAISRCSTENLVVALKKLKKLPLEAIYIVDSFGALYPEDIDKYMNCYMDSLSGTDIKIGIHTHNNQQCAFANTMRAIEKGAAWLDATVYGMGRGAGNCYLELLVGYLSCNKYKISPILNFIQKDMIHLREKEIVWGYNPYYFATGLFNIHPQSAIEATERNEEDFLQFYLNSRCI